MQCPRCQKSGSSSARACPHCGAPWEQPCSRCGTLNGIAHGQCRVCGMALKPETSEDPGPEDLRMLAYTRGSAGSPGGLRGLTPFTGRAQELAILLACLEKASAGERQLVTVAGEAGLGKSRLRHEFCQGLDASQVWVLEGRCQAHESTTPYLSFIHAIRRGLGLPAGSSDSDRVLQTIEGLVALDPSLERHAPLILHLLSLSSSGHALPPGLAGEEYRLALEAALVALIGAWAGRNPTVLVLEDWHWADEPSRAALSTLMADDTPLRLMVLVLHRTGYGLAWPPASWHTALALRPLDEWGTRVMIQAILGTSRLPDGFAALVHQRTAGNPFFVEEICLSLQEDGTLRVRNSALEMTQSVDRLTLPGTVQGIIEARVERLNPE